MNGLLSNQRLWQVVFFLVLGACAVVLGYKGWKANKTHEAAQKKKEKQQSQKWTK
jgi:Tfp pilus assembly protein PilO